MLNNFWSKYKIFSLEEAKKYLSSQIEIDLQQQILRSNSAALVLPGGKSIVHFFSMLQQIQVPWNKITLMLSDDRLVAANDLESNEKLIKKHFLNKQEIKENITYISIKERFLEKWENYYDIVTNLKKAIIILSMGQDGHVASLFAINDLSGEVGLKYISGADFKRVTLSYKAILSTYKIYIIVHGNKKIDFLKKTNINNFYLKELFILAEIILIKD